MSNWNEKVKKMEVELAKKRAELRKARAEARKEAAQAAAEAREAARSAIADAVVARLGDTTLANVDLVVELIGGPEFDQVDRRFAVATATDDGTMGELPDDDDEEDQEDESVSSAGIGYGQ
ncbi:hypothetical protein [Propionimicrobium sp. PCR01-08-3]|uniref:hypothetical protein n=1 Tax=Propionimicrobium sp. PCR01-08-3 TaxID=3052086 RepID=UPI00255CA10B|nr:hypothetical protein [Propionimicrobium sp. PCR01-08-3]WIY83941.1 hypothetical protein QQ658_06255 [Propionimicrobium sp. PCR01-08-3]